MYACPHCGKPGISLFRRAFLGPAIPATCVTCGRKSGVPLGKSMMALLPFIMAIIIAAFIRTAALSASIWSWGYCYVCLVVHVCSSYQEIGIAFLSNKSVRRTQIGLVSKLTAPLDFARPKSRMRFESHLTRFWEVAFRFQRPSQKRPFSEAIPGYRNC